MEQAFYKDQLINKFGLDVVILEKKDRQQVHDIIYNELCQGQIKASSKKVYLEIVSKLADQGAEGIILGCTEIGILIKADDTDLVV
jgi:aspartate racemase